MSYSYFKKQNKTLKNKLISYKMVHCQACGVTEKARCYGITFHRFPKNTNQRNAWIDFINKDKESKIISNYTTLCSQHFEETCFDKTSRMKTCLKPLSIPTIHISRPKYSKYEDIFTKITTAENDETFAVNIQNIPTNATALDFINNNEIEDMSIPSKNKTFAINVPNISPDVPEMDSNINNEIEKLNDESSEEDDLLLMNTSSEQKLNDVSSSNEESLPLNFEASVSNKILQSDTPRKTVLKKRIISMGRLLATKSTLIRNLQKKNWKQQKKIFKLKSVIQELNKKNLISCDNTYTLMQEFGPNEQLINRLFKKTTRGSTHKKYEEEIRKFAITLHFFSGKAYEYVRRKFYNALPHPKTLGKWYSTINASPGLSTEALNMIKAKAKSSERRILCSLVMDEMAIRKKIEFDGNKYYGYVDFGISLDQDRVIAREALVFMIVAINDTWKCPVGYFFINGLNGIQKMNLITQCIKALLDCNINVISLTFDGCQSNLVMAKLLGCTLNLQNMKTSFKIINHNIQVLLDPAHMAKLIRNTFAEIKIMIDENGDIIDYNFIIKLHELQETEGLHLANKLRKQHINFFRQKMKVKLATQLLSRSVAESLKFCKEKLNLADFKKCDATINFILIINDVFDVLNSHKISDFGFKKALCEQNVESIKNLAIRFNKYISCLKFSNGQKVVESKRKTGFIGFAICLQSIINIYDMYINCKNPSIQYLPVYKCSQDHIELFFGSIRSHGGYNNNPTCRQFQAAYKRLLIHAEIREGGLGNCIPLEQVDTLNCSSSQNSEDKINNSCSASSRKFLESLQDGNDDIYIDHDYFFTNMTLSHYCTEVVTYIAGFIVHKLGKSLACESCVAALFGIKDNLMGSLINIKDRGGLAYPSNDCINICIICEKFFKRELFIQQDVRKIKKDKLIQLIMKECLHTNIFDKLQSHVLDNHPLENHVYLLLKAIANNYFNLRIRFVCNNLSTNDSIRHFYTKLILFKGQ